METSTRHSKIQLNHKTCRTRILLRMFAVCFFVYGVHGKIASGQQPVKKEDRGVAVIQDKDFESLPKSTNPSFNRFPPLLSGKTVIPIAPISQINSSDSAKPVQGNSGSVGLDSSTLPNHKAAASKEAKPVPETAPQDGKPTPKIPNNAIAKKTLNQGVADEIAQDNALNEASNDDGSADKNNADNNVDQDDEDQESSSNQSWSVRGMTDRKSLPSTVQMIISVAAISLVPAILLMTTCFIRIVVVLGILRQAIGLQQLPPTQVTTALALMLTFLIMAPTWKQVKQDAIDPYSAEGSTMSWEEAWQKGVTPIKKFMWHQIQRAENENDFWLFYDYLPQEERSHEPTSLEEIPLKVLLPAFMISELKVAFLIGVQVLLPFLILDIVVASLCNTMGLIMMPPTVVSLPLKLLLFVMVDGWNLIVTMLLESFSQVT